MSRCIQFLSRSLDTRALEENRRAKSGNVQTPVSPLPSITTMAREVGITMGKGVSSTQVKESRSRRLGSGRRQKMEHSPCGAGHSRLRRGFPHKVLAFPICGPLSLSSSGKRCLPRCSTQLCAADLFPSITPLLSPVPITLLFHISTHFLL